MGLEREVCNYEICRRKKENKNTDGEKHIKASKITEFEEKVIEIKRVSKKTKGESAIGFCSPW